MARTNLPTFLLFSETVNGLLYVPPAAPVPTTATTGGTVAAGVYLVAVSYINAQGETIGSSSGSVTTTGTTSTITVPSPPANGNATGWNAYVSQVGGSLLTLQNATPNAIGTNLLISAPPTSTGAIPVLNDPAATTADQANGMNIKLASGAIPSAPKARHLVLRVANTAAGPFNLIVRAGGGPPPAFRAALGDLVVPILQSSTKWVGPFEAARHMQNDNSINVDFAAGFVGTITAFLVPTY